LFSKAVPSEIFESRYLALESAAFLSKDRPSTV
jgi:hypothetical protein